MARPQKDGIDYFPLDTDFFRADKRIRSLLMKYGTNGISFLLYLYCDIYANGYYVIVDDDYIQSAVRDLGMSENAIRQVLRYLLERSLFEYTLFQSVNVLTSPGVQRRFMNAVKERVRKRRSPVIVEKAYWMIPEEEFETETSHPLLKSSILKFLRGITPIKPGITPVFPWNNPQRKVKERKVKESIYISAYIAMRETGSPRRKRTCW